jgi:lipoprotein signal peptidase
VIRGAAGRRLLLVLALLTLAAGLDQATKELARRHLTPGDVRTLAGGTVRLQYAENRGATLSLESWLPAHRRGAPVTLAVSGLAGAGLLFLLLSPSLPALVVAGGALACGGVLSNLLDRVTRGRVVDFLSLEGLGRRSDIFNLADAAIATGLAMILGAALYRRRQGQG